VAKVNKLGFKTWEGEGPEGSTAGARRLRGSVALPMRYQRLRIGLSVRMLLIGMTLVAVILGVVMWAAHR
jgi:hypothetical protein